MIPPLRMVELCRDHGVPHATDGNEHCREGWVQLHCPLCHDSNYHLGYNLDNGYFACYHCGGVSVVRVLMAVLPNGISIRRTIEEYTQRISDLYRRRQATPTKHAVSMEMPKDCGPLQQVHKRYLTERGFDPAIAVNTWGAMATSHIGWLSWRIILPIRYQKELVAWTARAISKEAKKKYLSTPDAMAVIPVKECVYNSDGASQHDWCVVTEGPLNVWRLGDPAVATFGDACTATQVKQLAQWQYRFIVPDNDGPGKTPGGPGLKAAERLAAALYPFAGKTTLVYLPNGI